MEYNLIAEEWFGFAEEMENGDLILATEKAAAKELVEAKGAIPEHHLQASGLDRVDSAEELLHDRQRLVHIAAYFAEQSTEEETRAQDGVMLYEAAWFNTHLFHAVLLIGFAAAVYHIACGVPMQISIVLEEREHADAMEPLVRTIASVFSDVQACSVGLQEDDEEDEEDEAEDTEEEDGGLTDKDRQWMRELDEEVVNYAATGSIAYYTRILSLILRGVEHWVHAAFEAEIAPEAEPGKAPVGIRQAEGPDGSRYLALLSRIDDDVEVFGSQLLIAALDEVDIEDLAGIMINPGREAILIDRLFTTAARDLFASGIQFGQDRAEPEDEDEDEDEDYASNINEIIRRNEEDHTLHTARPMTEEEYAEVEERIRYLGRIMEDYVVLAFDNYLGEDSVIQIRVEKIEDSYEVEITMDFSDYGCEEPIVLQGSLTLEQTLDLYRSLGLEGKQTGDMEYVMNHFRAL